MLPMKGVQCTAYVRQVFKASPQQMSLMLQNETATKTGLMFSEKQEHAPKSSMVG